MEQSSCILSTAYWGPIQYFTKVASNTKIWIEQHETYPKQTYRNRCNIYSPNGLQTLNIPVLQGSFHKLITKDIQVAYNTNWQKNHIKSIEAAYKSSPFYDYFIDDIMPIYESQTKYLLDLNNKILELCNEWLQFDVEINLTTDFELESPIPDFRKNIHPKPKYNLIDSSFKTAFYLQGFEQRHGFIENLSILDLVFNMGNEAALIIKQSHIK